MRQLAIIVILAAAAGTLAACDMTQRVVGAINPDTISLADRCAAVMQQALPGAANIEITAKKSANAGVSALVAQVEGVRHDGSQPPDIAVECQFDNATMTGFRWTKGGPPAPPSSPQPSPPPAPGK
jgi:hypothetical protein